jgi:hypothetical protein
MYCQSTQKDWNLFLFYSKYHNLNLTIDLYNKGGVYDIKQ